MKTLRLTESEMRKIINALDFYSRIWMGQYDNILSNMRFYMNIQQLDDNEEYIEELLLNIRHILLPGLDKYDIHGSYGIFSNEINPKAATAYNMQQEFRYKLAYFIHPQGGITVDFNKPLPAELDKCPWPKAECVKTNDQIFVDITVCDEQINIIKDALQIAKFENNANITDLFNYYTDDQIALNIAKEITKIFSTIETDERFYPNIDEYDNIIKKLEE